MKIFDLVTTREIENQLDWYQAKGQYFIFCDASEVTTLQQMFLFDDSTIMDCMTVDENVRFESFAQYDFISLIHLSMQNGNLINNEVNVYIGPNYLVLIPPADPAAAAAYEALCRGIISGEKRSEYLSEQVLNILYYKIFDKLITDLFFMLEAVEDQVQAVESLIITKAEKSHFGAIARLKEMTGRIKKMFRPLLYVGDQFVVNENGLIPQEMMRYFKHIDIRLNKLYDFAANLGDMTDQLIYLFDSKIASQTNEIVTRLTILTLFFSPLTVITGIYGMNFIFMPELKWYFGYPLAILLMAGVTGFIYFVLKKKKWM